MSQKAIAFTVCIILCAACVLHALYYYPLLPDMVAAHFDAAGSPDGWAAKNSFMAAYLGAALFIMLLFSGISLGIARLPDSKINIPDKEYWLAPQRRRQTFDLIAQFMFWLAAATLALVLDISNQSIQVQMGRSSELDHPFSSIMLYLGFSLTWAVALMLRFQNSKSDGSRK